MEENNFKSRFKKLMKERKLSFYRLEKITGVPSSTIRNWFKKECPSIPSAEHLMIFCDLFCVSPELLWRGRKTGIDTDRFIRDEKEMMIINLFRQKEAPKSVEAQSPDQYHPVQTSKRRKKAG